MFKFQLKINKLNEMDKNIGSASAVLPNTAKAPELYEMWLAMDNSQQVALGSGAGSGRGWGVRVRERQGQGTERWLKGSDG